MGAYSAADSRPEAAGGWARAAVAGESGGLRRDFMDFTLGRTLARFT